MKKVYRTILIGAIVLSVLLAFLRYDVVIGRFFDSLFIRKLNVNRIRYSFGSG